MAPGFVTLQIPVGHVREPLHMTIQKEELGTVTVDLGVGIAFTGDGGEASVVEKPNERRGIGHASQRAFAAFSTGAGGTSVEGIMKEHSSIAGAWIGGANPSLSGQGDGRIGSPRTFLVIGRETDEGWQVGIPCVSGRDAIGCPIHGKQVVLLGCEGMGGDTPSLEVRKARDAAGQGQPGR